MAVKSRSENDSSLFRLKDFWRGSRTSLPMMLGLIPSGMVLGAFCVNKGFPVWGVPMLTGLNFAGGSEFASVALWTMPPNILLIAAVTLLINSRHILMGAVFSLFMKGVPARRVLPVIFFMCDESWAMALSEASRQGGKKDLPALYSYYIGVCAVLYTGWVLSSMAGAFFAPFLGSDIRTWGLDMAFPTTFFVLLRGMWKGCRKAIPWAVSLFAAILAYLWLPKGWSVPAGTAAGLLVVAFMPAGTAKDTPEGSADAGGGDDR